MKIKVDYHFHPNLPRNNKKAEELCKKWWAEFKKAGIKCVIVAEHVYKNPKRAYEFMEKTRPKDCFCFPGLEYLTKENVDIVLFSNDPSIYKYTLLKPFNLSYRKFISFVLSKKQVYSFVTHPFTIGKTSIIKNIGEAAYFSTAERLGAVEISNSSYDTLYALLRVFPLRLFFRKKLEWIKKIKNLPKKYYPKKIKFLAAGSDAHLPLDVGTCFELSVPALNKKSIFSAIITNKKGRLIKSHLNHGILVLARYGFIALKEYLIKKRIILCGY